MGHSIWSLSLEYAIGRGDIPMLSQLLQEAEQPIPPEIARQLGDLLDPARPRKPGPKPKKKYYGATHHLIISFYYYLCDNPDTAVEYVYPGRDVSQKILKEEIRDFICKLERISQRKFEDLRAEYNKRR